MPRLTDKARDVLHVLARAEVPFTAGEIAAGVARRNGLSVWRPVGEAELMNGRLRRLEAKGLVERRGVAAIGRGVQCWDITEAGRYALLEDRRKAVKEKVALEIARGEHDPVDDEEHGDD